MTSVADYKLFTPLALGDDLVLQNRVIMAPMGRARADTTTYEPLEIAQTYYAQRAGAGLIVSEATPISEQGYGWYGSPALYTPAHAAAWKKVTDAVHARGGKIFLQLWHVGRQSHSSFNAKREVVAPSAIAVPTGQIRNNQGDHVAYETPRALETHEIPGIADDFRKGAALAKLAGFDGVEIHAANGYLIDTFLQSSTNHRTDQYGGSIENRMRLLLEVLDAVLAEWPPHRVGVRLSPNGVFGCMGSADNFEQFTATAARLDGRGLAYLALLDGPGFGFHDKGRLVTALDVKRVFSGNVFVTTGYTRDIAEGALRSGAADAVCFGRPFIANPDLVERFRNDWPLAPMAPYEHWWDPSKGSEGYTTYSAYEPEKENEEEEEKDTTRAVKPVA